LDSNNFSGRRLSVTLMAIALLCLAIAYQVVAQNRTPTTSEIIRRNNEAPSNICWVLERLRVLHERLDAADREHAEFPDDAQGTSSARSYRILYDNFAASIASASAAGATSTLEDLSNPIITRSQDQYLDLISDLEERGARKETFRYCFPE
jgi:hypothetical protein